MMRRNVFRKTMMAAALLCSSFGARAGIVVSETAGGNSFPLVKDNTAVPVVIDKQDAKVVGIVAEAFSNDVDMVAGVKPEVRNEAQGMAVIVGTLGRSAWIDQMANTGKVDKSRLEGQWETFSISVVDNPVAGVSQALVVAGSDPRGTAFGVFELSRLMGVSPWVWWADVVPATRQAIYVSGTDMFGPPSVKYRGLFINDEDFGMKPWAAAKMDPGIRPNGNGDIGPNTYAKVCELLLRTKSNFLWPAMHACTWAFWYYKDNPEIARDYSIVLGSSHCEQMLRNNEDEWKRNFSNEYPGVTKGDWNWKTNRNTVERYWRDRVKESKGIDAVFTLGMRGVHDSQMEGYGNDDERAAALKEIIGVQRDMLEEELGKPKNEISQLLCPYKEVLLQYNKGIGLPDDVTLLWPDDNHGFIRQLSTPEEQKRSGGSGVYYHFSYWAPPHQTYLWLTSTSPVKTSYEMSKAYDMNAKDIWVFNVGDLKHAEFEYQFAADLAWDVDAWRPEKAHGYMKFWAEETFGSELAEDIAGIMSRHYLLSAAGRPEHTPWLMLAPAEMEQRMAGYKELTAMVAAVEGRVPARLKDAYFELVKYPVVCTAAMNEKIFSAELSFVYAREGKTAEAEAASAQAKSAYKTIQDLTNYYNKTVAGGKWDKMVNYAPRQIGFFYDPDVADENALKNEAVPAEIIPQAEVLSAKECTGKSSRVKVIEQLGVTGAALTVLPFDMTEYTASSISSAPYAEYKVQLHKGENRIRVMCLPTFPLYPGLDLRYAISVDGGKPEFVSIARLENDEEWRTNILRGYARGDKFIKSDTDKTVTVKIYFADPGLVLSGIETTTTVMQDNDLTHLLVNPDFELASQDSILPPFTLKRYDPYGWTRTGGSLTGKSWGVNQDALNMHGEHICWYASDPMPGNFELSQTVKGLPAGEYVVRCRLGVPSGLLTTQRLFANGKVMHYGKASDYGSNLKEGEENLFAGYTPGYESGPGVMIELREMALKFTVLPGEDVKLGIRTSNQLKDGSFDTKGRSGWFKVDYFRLERVKELTGQDLREALKKLIAESQELYDATAGGQYTDEARAEFNTAINAAQSVAGKTDATAMELGDAIKKLQKAIEDYKKQKVTYTSYLKNPSFEHYLDGTPIDVTSTTDPRIERGALRTTPPGWMQVGEIKGTSFGINRDALNVDGYNACWYTSKPMPDDFELYQNVTGLPAGEYTVRCRMCVPNGLLTTQRLFANNQVQYYGKQTDYKANIVPGEEAAFAGLSTNGNYELQEMEVNVVLEKGETLKLGIRTGHVKPDGSEATNDAGFFKVDHFRLELKELHEDTGLPAWDGNSSFSVRGEKGCCVVSFKETVDAASLNIYSLSGERMYDDAVTKQETRIPLPRGLYVVVVSAGRQESAAKVLVS